MWINELIFLLLSSVAINLTQKEATLFKDDRIEVCIAGEPPSSLPQTDPKRHFLQTVTGKVFVIPFILVAFSVSAS